MNKLSQYRHVPMMGPIANMGEEYEDVLNDLLETGCLWLDEQIDVAHTNGSKELIISFITNYTDTDEQSLTCISPAAAYLMDHLKREVEAATDLMIIEVMKILLFIATEGWNNYVAHSVLNEVSRKNEELTGAKVKDQIKWAVKILEQYAPNKLKRR
ncbi:MAG: hypothetical protein OXU36_10695 [Candidatus Poribacteria bacterium]|nr:hypothetical protein [Candidatus Poribacteria bacterium]